MNSKKTDCFSKDKTYNRFVLGLDLASLKELESIDEKKTIIGLISLYFITAAIVFVSIQLTSFSYFFLYTVRFFNCRASRRFCSTCA